MATTKKRDIEVDLNIEGSRAIIEGKTSVPFQAFVKLILQRKISNLFKTHSEEPIIVESSLLTSIASAPNDSPENRAHLVLVTLGVGILVGVFISSVAIVALYSLNISFGRKEALIVAIVLLGIAGLTAILAKTKQKNRTQKIADAMERVASMLSK
ncbi:hypothetical protein HN512_00395 [Candidatus Peregrinibacteria bacterium]|jgi:hypothetical protein|nr:hypothetical protein [Candidatus Peregrinibacteria bacterium]MBT3598286.1 hypothetical protein [Candidatus Peregrinibacteria bacterium]MBT4366921.1 hypothetical protein [Candidatus Peregrinibacteria bacterium]MBT4585302.1 hypothetical protein [Candidatus Peregrinibacteria bacterium]MBT6731041.1 hypothetical protein [Candidatus Peregrinibacteria bacterium]